MTLKQRFENTMISFLIDRNQDKSMLDHFEKLTDEFAIEFADWIRVCKLKRRPYDFDNIKELLEIYKKEKGL
jgi:hypothetical protein